MSDGERSYVEEARRDKRAQLVAMGVAPFAYRFERSHAATAALALWNDSVGEDGPRVSVAGRLVALRGQGKTVFAHLEDASGRIQLYFKRDHLPEQWPVIELLDLDDHVGVAGRIFKTRTGEVTVAVENVVLLAKSL
ncbi:MAG: OB-fold nucleic acid binding domain-containing protein, partial [Gemmatimonadales bacterium]